MVAKSLVQVIRLQIECSQWHPISRSMPEEGIGIDSIQLGVWVLGDY